ncbi:MAG: Xaa-Pro aminopeptidase [Myxococcota bacterium]|nr:Xaa-Pro aminopeptidase [Myxococcota bacterium]
MYAQRRAEFSRRVKNGLAIFASPLEACRNRDVLHDFRQDSDLYYLTGFDEPESILVLSIQDGVCESTLFLRPRDVTREIWDGVRLGVERAPEHIGVDHARAIDTFSEVLPQMMLGSETVYYGMGRDGYEHTDKVVIDALTRARNMRRRTVIAPKSTCEPDEHLHAMRAIKTAPEIELMRKAAKLTNLGHQRAMAVTRPGVREYQVEAAMEYEWAVRGAMRNAYPSIVGSGPNACVLHYRAGERIMLDGELVLVDAGCEYQFYASDVTRTWPVSGRFSPVQAQLYELVLQAEQVAIDICRPGRTINEVHEAAVKVLVAGLLEIGLLEGTLEDVIASEAYRQFYMHNTSHWIGLDVHDVGVYQENDRFKVLEAGMVLTVEPGIYIQPDDDSVPPEYRGIGIRIEDDVLVTTGEPDVLTACVPKTIDAIEKLVGSSPIDL